jgi:hypothetical protein
MRRRPASLSAARLCSPSGILRASSMTSVARSSQKRLSGGCSAFCTVIALCPWRKGLPECIGLNHHLVKEITLRALKRAEIETHACRHDASEHHVSAALWASWAMEVEVDVVRQEIGFLHDAFPRRGGGSATLSVTGKCLGRSVVIGTTLGSRVPRRCSILIILRSPVKLC